MWPAVNFQGFALQAPEGDNTVVSYSIQMVLEWYTVNPRSDNFVCAVIWSDLIPLTAARCRARCRVSTIPGPDFLQKKNSEASEAQGRRVRIVSTLAECR